MSEKNCDVVVLGAGPAGYVAAIRLAQYGKKVICIDEDNLGGTCLNWGCIPSKALIAAGHFLDQVRHAADMGFTVSEPELDLGKLIAWKDTIVTRLTGGIGMLFKKRGVEWVKGSATIAGPNKLSVKTAEGVVTIQARDIVLASGSEPAGIPGFEFGEFVWSSTEALSPKELPKELLIIGGGVIGLELGMFYQAVGSQVRIIEYTDQVLPGTDPELVKVVQRRAKKMGIQIHSGAGAQSWKKKGRGVEVSVKIGDKTEVFAADRILLTTGRKPRTANIGLEKIGLKADQRGFLHVDEQCQTKTPHVWAVGDCTTGPMLAHKGSAQGLVAAGAIAQKAGIAWDDKIVPSVIFTDPEIASAGLSEAEAKELGYETKVGRFNFGANGRAMALHATEGLVKIVTDAKDDRLLGVHMVGPSVTDMIAEAVVAIETGLTAEDLSMCIHPHPTLSEVVMEAAEDVHGLCVHAAK
jgi:dihydrolipoyl dehydrogenase